MSFIVWWDNGSGWLEATAPIEAASREEALWLVEKTEFIVGSFVTVNGDGFDPNRDDWGEKKGYENLYH